MSDLYEPQISTALHDRVDGLSPDLSSLAAGAVRQGTRLRRRRTATTVAAAFAVIGVIGGTAATATLLADDSSDGRSETPVLGQPEAELPFTFIAPAGWQCADPVEQEFGCTRGADSVTVGWDTVPAGDTVDLRSDLGLPDGSYGTLWRFPDNGPLAVWVEVPGSTADPVAVRDEFTDSVRPADGAAAQEPSAVNPEPPGGSAAAPILITPPEGWSCGTYADEKFPCIKDDRVFLSVNTRPATDHDEWVSSPDKGGPGSGVLVSDVHGEWFVSIQPGQGYTEADAQELAQALTWADDGTPVF